MNVMDSPREDETFDEVPHSDEANKEHQVVMKLLTQKAIDLYHRREGSLTSICAKLAKTAASEMKKSSGGNVHISADALRKRVYRSLKRKDRSHGNQLLSDTNEAQLVEKLQAMLDVGTQLTRTVILDVVRKYWVKDLSWDGSSWFRRFVQRHQGKLNIMAKKSGNLLSLTDAKLPVSRERMTEINTLLAAATMAEEEYSEDSLTAQLSARTTSSSESSPRRLRNPDSPREDSRMFGLNGRYMVQTALPKKDDIDPTPQRRGSLPEPLCMAYKNPITNSDPSMAYYPMVGYPGPMVPNGYLPMPPYYPWSVSPVVSFPCSPIQSPRQMMPLSQPTTQITMLPQPPSYHIQPMPNSQLVPLPLIPYQQPTSNQTSSFPSQANPSLLTKLPSLKNLISTPTEPPPAKRVKTEESS